MKNQKGITLVALIITIIVMVILAGVIILSAVADGGIIDRAQGAMKQKEKGELEDLIIASYEYKTGASSNVYAYLDLNATAGNIWNNLTNNGFTLKDGSGNEYTSDTEFVNGQKGPEGTIDEIEINAEGKHGEYEGTVTDKGLEYLEPIIGGGKEPSEDEDEVVGEGLELQISQNYNVITDTSTLTITPKVTEEFFDENYASQVVGNALNLEGITENTDLAEFNYKLYNFLTTISGMPFYGGNTVNDFKELTIEISSKMENPEPTEQEVAAYLFASIGWEYKTIEESAMDMYEPTISELAISNTKDVWEQIAGGENWDIEEENYVVTENGTYTIKLTVDEKVIEKTIDISEIGVDYGEWIKNADGTYTKNNTTIEIGKTKITDKELKAKLKITEESEYKQTWTIIGVDGNNIKVVSSSHVGNVKLGEIDTRVTENDIKQLSDIGTNDNYRKAVWSYMHAIETLNIKAADATKIPEAKSITINDIYDIIGEENVDKGDSYGKTYRYYRYGSISYSKYRTGIDADGNDIWSTPINMEYNQSVYGRQIFVDENGGLIKLGMCQDNEGVTLTHNSFSYYLTDAQKEKIGDLITDVYWLASPTIKCTDLNVVYGMFNMDYGNINNTEIMFSSSLDSYLDTWGVRAVISF